MKTIRDRELRARLREHMEFGQSFALRAEVGSDRLEAIANGDLMTARERMAIAEHTAYTPQRIRHGWQFWGAYVLAMLIWLPILGTRHFWERLRYKWERQRFKS